MHRSSSSLGVTKNLDRLRATSGSLLLPEVKSTKNYIRPQIREHYKFEKYVKKSLDYVMRVKGPKVLYRDQVEDIIRKNKADSTFFEQAHLLSTAGKKPKVVSKE